MMKSERDVGDGFVDKVDHWEESKDWADVIIFDDCEFGRARRQAARRGQGVVGGTPYTDRLEDGPGVRPGGDEGGGRADPAPSWEFDSFDAAIAFIKANPGRYVVKPSGKAQNEKVLSFVGQEEDGLDVLTMLEHYKKGWSSRSRASSSRSTPRGVEVAVGAFFNGRISSSRSS